MTPHQQVFVHSYEADWYDSTGKRLDDPPESKYTGLCCATCGDLSIYLESVEGEEGGFGALVFPAEAALDRSIPDAVAVNYREAKRVQKVSPNAFAVLMRRALEALGDDRMAPQGTLHKRLRFLAEEAKYLLCLSR